MRDPFLALTSQTSDEMFRLMEMPKVRETVANNRVTFYELLESHGDKENMVKFGKLLQDYDYVVKLYLQDGQYGRALEMLESQRRTFDEKDPYYKYGPLMMPQVRPLKDAIFLFAPGGQGGPGTPNFCNNQQVFF